MKDTPLEHLLYDCTGSINYSAILYQVYLLQRTSWIHIISSFFDLNIVRGRAQGVIASQTWVLGDGIFPRYFSSW